MTYAIHASIAESPVLRRRIVACAAQEGVSDPVNWASRSVWHLVKRDWIDAVAYAYANNYDGNPFEDEAVITEGMILASVQGKIEAEKPVQQWSKQHLLTWLTSMGYTIDPAVTDPMTADQVRALADGLISGRAV
jgi:hypothetical protein